MKGIYRIVALVFLLLGGVLLFMQSDDSNVSEEIVVTGIEHSIVLTSDGYEPRAINIGLGDTIVFTTSDVYPDLHWPASNIHPTHSIYSEFDPLRPVPSDEPWSFTFTRVGEWKFHDHLNPRHTGTITVTQ